MPSKRRRAVPAALLVLALACLGLAGAAQAELTGEYVKFQHCPWHNEEVKKCLYSVTEGGEVVLGTKTVTIENDVVLQGGFGKPNKETKISQFYGAEGAPTLTPVSQNVPGGLLGVVPTEKQNWLIKRLIKFFFENSLTGLGSTLELAGSASNIQISENHLSHKEGTALQLPIKIHLENPFLGSKCYVGSNSNPVIWPLTSGETSPNSPNESIWGTFGHAEFLDGGYILHITENSLVENNWAAPSATGCGGILAFLVNPIVNYAAGLPSSAGHNTAILNNTVDITTPFALNKNEEENP